MGERQLQPTYKVVKSESFIQQYATLRAIYARLDDLLDAICWALARHPHRFTKLPGDYYLWLTGNIDNPDIPKIQTLYNINEEILQVTLLGIDDVLEDE